MIERPLFPVAGADVAKFMGRSADSAFAAQAHEHVQIVAQIVNAYVRGPGATWGDVDGVILLPDDLRAVVITATARLVGNPQQLESESADGYAARGSFKSFSLAEQSILHRYRRRVA